MLSGASIGNVQEAKDLIYGALIGLGLLLGSYLLLYTIDPTLTNLSPRLPPAINLAAPKEILGVDYGMAETATTETFIYTTDQIGNRYTPTSISGCESFAATSDYNTYIACIAQKGCEQLASELSQTKNQKLISSALNAGKCSITLEKSKQ